MLAGVISVAHEQNLGVAIHVQMQIGSGIRIRQLPRPIAPRPKRPNLTRVVSCVRQVRSGFIVAVHVETLVRPEEHRVKGVRRGRVGWMGDESPILPAVVPAGRHLQCARRGGTAVVDDV